MPPAAEVGGGFPKLHELREEVRPEDAVDPHRAAFNRAMLVILDNTDVPDTVGSFIPEILQNKPNIGSGHLVTVLRRSGAHLFLDMDIGFPERFVTPEAYLDGFGAIYASPALRQKFEYDVLNRELQSNVPERYKGLKLFAQLAKQVGRLSTCHVVDIGASQNAGLNQVALGLPFKEPEVLLNDSSNDILNRSHVNMLYSLMNGRFDLDLSVGIDLEPRGASREWALACSFEAAELLEEDRVALFKRLIKSDHPNVRFFQDDYAYFNRHEFVEKFPQEFDIVHACTSLYQADPEAREVMIENAKLQAGEFVVVQDFVEVDTSGRELLFRSDWGKKDDYPYRTVVLDMQQERPLWQEVFRWTDGRVRKLDIGLGRIATGLSETASVFSILDRMVREAGKEAG